MNIMNYAQREVLRLNPRSSIDEAIGLMESQGVHHLVVVEDGRVVGMLADRDVLLSTGWMLSIERAVSGRGGRQVIGPTEVGQIMSRPAVTLTHADTARDAARLMYSRKIGALPILHGEHLVAIVTHHDLLRWLNELAVGDSPAAAFLARSVRQEMRTTVIMVDPTAPLGDVIDVFRRFRVRHVPVVENERLVGILSDRDVRRALGWSVVRETQAEERGRMFEPPSRAGDLMKTEVQTIAAEDVMRHALHRMLEHHIHSLPVIEGSRLAGIITQTDFVRALAERELI